MRAEKEAKTELGLKASDYSSKGLLAPDNLVAKVVERFYHNHKLDKGILFDGYPRNIEQAKHLIEVIEKDGGILDKIVFLKVPKEELLKRAVIRAKEENRKDDKDSDIVLTRINEFENSTIPAVNYIKGKGVRTLEVEGNQSIDSIYEIIKKELNA